MKKTRVRWTTESIIAKANEVHDFKYDYSKATYTKIKDKVSIICPLHGDFIQSFEKHIHSKTGCPDCKRDVLSKLKTKSNEQFLQEAIEIHGDQFDYSNVNYISCYDKVSVVCNKCLTVFDITPKDHLTSRNGCPVCCESKGERELRRWLNHFKINFISQYRFPDCKFKRPLPFDFYLPDQKKCIEFDGGQHFAPVKFFGGKVAFNLQQRKDSIKEYYCNENNIQLIRISDITKIKEVISLISQRDF